MKGHHVGAAGDGRRSSTPTRLTARAASRLVVFWCVDRHATTVRLAADVAVPQRWQCAQCGAPAGPDPAVPPAPEQDGRGRSHLEQLLMRRTPEEGAQALAEALDRLHALRAAGDVPSG